jgi:hypothetical protein
MLFKFIFGLLEERYPNHDWRAIRTRVAWVVVDVVVINWPLSMFTYAQSEPPVTLSLSWLAILIEAVTLLTSSQIHEEAGSD